VLPDQIRRERIYFVIQGFAYLIGIRKGVAHLPGRSQGQNAMEPRRRRNGFELQPKHRRSYVGMHGCLCAGKHEPAIVQSGVYIPRFLYRPAKRFLDIQVKRGVRFVEAGNLASSGGLSSGIDLALRVVERYYGREAARQTAFGMEYGRRVDEPELERGLRPGLCAKRPTIPYAQFALESDNKGRT
jgi:hypothetical protein